MVFERFAHRKMFSDVATVRWEQGYIGHSGTSREVCTIPRSLAPFQVWLLSQSDDPAQSSMEVLFCFPRARSFGARSSRSRLLHVSQCDTFLSPGEIEAVPWTISSRSSLATFRFGFWGSLAPSVVGCPRFVALRWSFSISPEGVQFCQPLGCLGS